MKINITKSTLIQAAILAAAFVFVYQKAISELIYDWSNNPNFSHGFLIPLVALYMIWFKKNELRLMDRQSSFTGVIVIILGMLIHIVGNVGSELFLMRFSMIITLSGIILYLFGKQIFYKISIPIAYLILMIPLPQILWNRIAFPLQLFAAAISAKTISLLSIPVFREGNILHLANTSLEVVDACSGLRSLTSLLALTGAFAYIARLGTIKKWILFFSAIPIAVVVNVIRLTITGCMAAWIGPETAHGFLHDMSGLIIFGAALILVYLVYQIMLKLERSNG